MVHPGPVASTLAESLRIWRPPDLEALELRLGTSVRHSYPKHWHEEIFFSAITAGAGHFQVRGSDHVASPGTLVVVVPGEVHAHDDRHGGRSFRALHMAPAFFSDAALELAPGRHAPLDFSSSLIGDGRMFRSFLALHRSFEGSSTRLQRDALLSGFIARLLRHVQDDVRPSR